MIGKFILNKLELRSMKGLSPLISMVLVVAFGFAAMTIVLTIVNPMLDRAKDSGIVNEATQNMQLVDSAVRSVASEARGSKRTIGIKITEGVLRSNTTSEQIYFEYEPKTRNILDGFSGDIKIESRPVFLEYFNQYSDSATASDHWTSVNGTWSVSSGRFLGRGGISFHNTGNQSSFEIATSVIPSTAPDGQVFVVPGDPRNLILFLPFDGNVNTTITTAYDYSSAVSNGTLSNATSATCFTSGACPSWVTGQFGNATEFDGLGDYINLSTQFARSGNKTISFWIKPRNVGVGNVQYLYSEGGVGSSQFGATVRILTNRSIDYIEGAGSGGLGVSTTTLISNDTWYHIAVTYSNGTTNTSTMYVNGVQERQATGGAHGTYTSLMTHLGTYAAAINQFFNGTMDELMVWNRTLTAKEIAFLYDASTKKITSSGEIPGIAEDENVTIVLASPGVSYFDNVKLKSGPPKISFVVPYQNIDIVNQSRFGPGDHNIVVRHYGTNTTSNRPMIGLEE